MRRLDLRDPEKVLEYGTDHGGPLKLVQRTMDDERFPTPCHGEFIVVKWPSYTQWSARGERAANTTEYWLLQVSDEPVDDDSVFTNCKVLVEIQPGRKRKPVKALYDLAHRLRLNETNFGDDLACGYIQGHILLEFANLDPDQHDRLVAMVLTWYESKWSDRDCDLHRGLKSVLGREPNE